jgi:hypothetical protein
MEFSIPDANFDKIAPAKLAETGTYKLALTRKEIRPNRAEDGTNFEFDLMVVDDPQCEGITFTIYCGLPKPGDEDRMTKRAQSYKDFKLSMLKQRVESFGGSVVAGTVTVPDEAIVQAVVDKRMSNEGRPFNVIQEDTIKSLAGGGKIDLK